MALIFWIEVINSGGGVSGLDGRAFAWIVTGVGLSPIWFYTFPW